VSKQGIDAARVFIPIGVAGILFGDDGIVDIP
jgi:hypothetical protein